MQELNEFHKKLSAEGVESLELLSPLSMHFPTKQLISNHFLKKHYESKGQPFNITEPNLVDVRPPPLLPPIPKKTHFGFSRGCACVL
jgi:hypothetical protein